jgi:hypothetical protein
MNSCLEPIKILQVHFVAVEKQNKKRIERKDQKLSIAHPILYQT